MNNAHTLRSDVLRATTVSSRSWPGASAFASVTIALVVLFSTAAFGSTPQGSFDKTLTVSGPVNLEVLTRSGDVTVRTGASAAVIIHGRIFVGDRWLRGNRQADVDQIAQNPPIRQEGNTVHIDYLNNMRDISVDYEITVPVDTVVRTQTGSGDVKLARLTGEIRLQTGSGNIRGRELSGSVKGGTGSGDVEIEETSTGDIDMHTGSGNITVRGIQGGFHGEAGSGDITAEGTQTGPWEIRTGSGNVHVRLPANAAFDA